MSARLLDKVQVRVQLIILGTGAALFLLLTILLVHAPGFSDPAMMQVAMGNAARDAGLLGAALIIAGLSKS